jgi:MFS family permease
VIDAFGLRRGLALGAVLAAAGALAKGLHPGSFRMVLAGQVVLGLAQPFVLNAATTLGAKWFPLKERGLAVGLACLAQFLGITLAMVVGPLLVGGDPAKASYGQGLPALLGLYAIVTAGAALLCLAVVREAPAGDGAEEAARLGALEGARSLFAHRDYRLLLVLFTAGLGIFNALSSTVDAVAARIGVVASDGLLGTWMLGGGMLGALVLPALSDAAARRKPFMVACMAGTVPSVACLAFAGSLTHSVAAAYLLAKIAAGCLGFFVLSAGPIGFQYAAEVGWPAPEASTQGPLLLAGQVSGIAFVALMGRPALMGPVLAGFTVLAALCLGLSFLLRESPAFRR